MNTSARCTGLSSMLIGCVSVWGCAVSLPEPALGEARVAVQKAKADGAVVHYDEIDLVAAEEHLATAEDAAQRQDHRLADHESYLATQTARLAQARADATVTQPAAVSPYANATNQ